MSEMTQANIVRTLLEENSEISSTELVEEAKKRYNRDLNIGSVCSVLSKIKKETGVVTANKRQAILEVIKENPEDTCEQVIDKVLEQYNMNVSVGYVQSLKTKSKKKKNPDVPDMSDLTFMFNYLQSMNNGRQRVNNAIELLEPLLERLGSIERLKECIKFIRMVRK